MRTIAWLLLSALTVYAQPDGGYGGTDPEAAAQMADLDLAAQQMAAQELAAQQVRDKASALGGHIFRRVGGKVYNLWQTGQFTGGTVRDVQADVVIVGDGTLRQRAIRNYPGAAVADSYILTYAMRDGVYLWNGAQLELYDCGLVLTPDEEKQQVLAARQRAAAAEKAKTDAAAAKLAAQRARNYMVQSNVVFHLQTMASNGQVWAQCSLGLHYLNGQGCETNRPAAVLWLTLAATNGDYEASNTLARLKVVP